MLLMTDIEILESTYFDRCTIKRKVKAKNENTGVTETVEKIIVENVKCALSKSKKDTPVMTSDGVGKLAFSHLLFLNPNIDLLEVDIVEVSSMGKISIYLASKPFFYSSHSESLLSYKERA